MTIKLCCHCKQEKLLSEFRKDKTKKTGIQSYCKVCARSSIKGRYAATYKEKYGAKAAVRRAENSARIKLLKQQLGCACCSETDSDCIQFHHLDPNEKDFLVSEGGRSWNRIVEEIQKCVCVCANCHIKIHSGKIDTVLKSIGEDVIIDKLFVGMAEW